MRWKHFSVRDEGLRPMWMDSDDDAIIAAHGMTAAHDMLEHGDERYVTPELELQALGSMWWLRGEGGYFWGRHHPDVPNNVCGDLEQELRRAHWGGGLIEPPRTCRLDEHVEEEFTEGLRLACSGCAYTGDRIDPEELRRVRSYLRLGYRRARRLWTRRGHDAFSACEVFRRAEEELNKALRWADEYQTIRARLDGSTIKVETYYA